MTGKVNDTHSCYMWKKMKKSIKWDVLEKRVVVKKEQRENYQYHSHTMFHMYVKTA